MAVKLLLVVVLCLVVATVDSRLDPLLRLPSDRLSGGELNGEDDSVGTRWAVLIAGSSGYGNYRHQADVCHAYQVMKKGGLKDENIVVFMYDDIAYNEENPRQGIIINNPDGTDVYSGVPKDYVGEEVTVNNLFAVLLGNKTALTGGSGKVVDSGPNDHIFIFYSDHGGPGVLGMPTYPYLYADDLNAVLKQKYSLGTYKTMVFYLEACESGSIFEGLLSEEINVYATTASNAEESSWGCYCPGETPSPPAEYYTCLGDLYSISWMEDSDAHNLHSETLKQQYQIVKTRTSVQNTYTYGSHVMQYGNLDINTDNLYLYIGSNPENDNVSFIQYNSLPVFSKAVNQRDADLVYFWHKYKRAEMGSSEKQDAHKKLLDVMSHRFHVDRSVELIGSLLFGTQQASHVLNEIRPSGKPLVDEWSCLKSTVREFETYCGSLSQYGMKHMRAFANICNSGVEIENFSKVASQACTSFPSNPWSSIRKGFTA